MVVKALPWKKPGTGAGRGDPVGDCLLEKKRTTPGLGVKSTRGVSGDKLIEFKERIKE